LFERERVIFDMPFGIFEIGIGIAVCWVIYRYTNSSGDTSPNDPRGDTGEDNPREVELRRIMEDIRSTGGVDPQYYSTINLQVSMLGGEPKYIITNPKDQLRSLAELLLFLKQYDDYWKRRKIYHHQLPTHLAP